MNWPWSRAFDPTPDEQGPLSREATEPDSPYQLHEPVIVEADEAGTPYQLHEPEIIEAEPDAPTYEVGDDGELYGLTPDGVQLMPADQMPPDMWMPPEPGDGGGGG